MTLRVLVAAGGTGGHLYPGLAVLEALRARTSVEATFVGTARGIEARVLPKSNERLELLDVKPLNGVRGLALLSALARLPRAGWQCLALVRRVRPQVMLSVGGYASGPVTAAALALGVPTAVIEPNAVPGFTNRVLGRFVDRAFVTWEESERFFRAGRTRVVGTPVRRAFRDAAASALRTTEQGSGDGEGAAPHLLVLGGSQGAKVLNETAPAALGALYRAGLRFTVTHQTGAAMRDAVAGAYEREGLAAVSEATAFIDDVAAALARCSLLLARSGAGAVAEACVVGRPAVYVPLPTAADDHQRRNAEAVAARGAAQVLEQRALTPELLAETLRGLFAEPKKLGAMAAAARSLGRPDAAERVAEELIDISVL